MIGNRCCQRTSICQAAAASRRARRPRDGSAVGAARAGDRRSWSAARRPSAPPAAMEERHAHGLQTARPRLGDQRALDHDGDDQDPAVHDLQPGRVDLRESPAGSAAGRSRRRRRRRRSDRRGRRRATCRRARRPRSPISVYCVDVEAFDDCTSAVSARPPMPAKRPPRRVARDAHGGDVDAGREGRRVVRADGVQQPPERDVLEPEPDQQRRPRS